jgi:hypothetical protein
MDFDEGTVIVQSAGSGELRMSSVPSPLAWKKMILESGPVKVNAGAPDRVGTGRAAAEAIYS